MIGGSREEGGAEKRSRAVLRKWGFQQRGRGNGNQRIGRSNEGVVEYNDCQCLSLLSREPLHLDPSIPYIKPHEKGTCKPSNSPWYM